MTEALWSDRVKRKSSPGDPEKESGSVCTPVVSSLLDRWMPELIPGSIPPGGEIMRGHITAEEAIERWDRNAEELAATFTAEGDKHREVLLNPVLLELLGDLSGRTILDAGCGEGYLSRILAHRGARVTAVDFSRRQLEIARKRTPPELRIEYRHANLEKLDSISDSTFDVVVSNMVLQDLPNLDAAVREFHRVMKPNGFCVASIAHPCFAAPVYGWVKDEEGRKLHWRIDRYFDEGLEEQDYPLGAEKPVFLFHRTLTTYFRALRDADFSITDLVEPKPSPEKLEKYPGFRDDLRMCHFLVLSLRKSGR
jgi:ubiquinone/menaquinone biosynthesis C-methylase UbiE